MNNISNISNDGDEPVSESLTIDARSYDGSVNINLSRYIPDLLTEYGTVVGEDDMTTVPEIATVGKSTHDIIGIT